MINNVIISMTAGYSEPYDQLLLFLENYHKVLITNYDEYPQKLVWCLEHAQGKFRDLNTGAGVCWCFEKEHDASLFALMWG